MKLPKYSMGIGDRFGKQGEAQLAAIKMAEEQGCSVAPVWNKSFREHQIIGSRPDTVRTEADHAVRSLNWNAPYFVDADHISLKIVDDFIGASDFFTLDVADAIGELAEPASIDRFLSQNRFAESLTIDGLPSSLKLQADFLRATAEKYLFAIEEAGRIYAHIQSRKTDPFITEVSMDETDLPQTPGELLIILAMIRHVGIPAETIAPKFSGRFNKGVDYVGEITQFEQEFNADLAVIQYAITRFGLPDNLKLSVHSGSDKFKLYPVIRNAIQNHNAGVHLKTAGTTWLEELIGLAESQGDGLDIAKEIYEKAFYRFDALCQPYASVIDIDFEALPRPDTVHGWSGSAFAHALRHDQSQPLYNPHLRQLLHVGYKIAAEMGDRFLNQLHQNREIVNRHVTENLFARHIRPLFLS
jgi:hypothetical protein